MKIDFRNGNSTFLAIGLAASLSLTLTACGSTSNQPQPDSPTSTSSVAESEPSPAAPEPPAKMPHELNTENHERLGITQDTSISRKLADGRSYHPMTVDSGSPALQLENVGVQDGESEEAIYAEYSKEDVQDAVIYFSQFTVRDIYDSEASYNPTDDELFRHYNEIKSQLTSYMQSAFERDKNYRVFTNMKLKVATDAGVTFNQGENGENFAVVDMEVGNIYVDPQNSLLMTVRVISDYSMSLKTEDGSDTDHMTYRAAHDRAFALNKSDSGEWQIAGIWGNERALHQKGWKESEIQQSPDNGHSLTPRDVFEPVPEEPLLTF